MFEIRRRLWEKSATDFRKICHRLGFWIGLGQSSSFIVLNAQHVGVWVFEVLRLGVSRNKATLWQIGRVKCSIL